MAGFGVCRCFGFGREAIVVQTSVSANDSRNAVCIGDCLILVALMLIAEDAEGGIRV